MVMCKSGCGGGPPGARLACEGGHAFAVGGEGERPQHLAFLPCGLVVSTKH